MKLRDYFKLAGICSMMVLSTWSTSLADSFDPGLGLVINGHEIEDVDLALKNDRVLVPLRFISEYLGAQVEWQADLRRVDISKDGIDIRLWIDSHLVDYGDGTYGVCDVPPEIIEDRTYVPVRLVAEALNVQVDWNGESRQVLINDHSQGQRTDFYSMEIISHQPGETIQGRTDIEFLAHKDLVEAASEIRLLKIDPLSGRGYIVGLAPSDRSQITYLPKAGDQGDFVFVLAYYDENRQWVGGTAQAMTLEVSPQVQVILDQRQDTDDLVLSTDFNFMPYKVAYELTNVETGEVTLVSVADPFESYRWSVAGLDTGIYVIRALVYDHDQTIYESSSIQVPIRVEPYLYLGGVKQNQTISGETNLIASRNYDVEETIFTIEDVGTGVERVLSTIPWGTFKWTPDAGDGGDQLLRVKVVDTRGVTHVSPAIRVYVDLSPQVTLLGLGPDQVITSPVDLSIQSNVPLENISYYIEHVKTGEILVLDDSEVTYTPQSSFDGEIRVYASGDYQGRTYKTSSLSLSVYTGEIYGPQAIVAKDDFLPFVSELALKSFKETGMSAALQAAQGILETGWGQYVPVDKYNNQLSNNLFGIKGSGTNGSVISNTWEVYNGLVYRVDANFRAYHTVEESWDDHKRILLDLSRYQIFRDVMYDSTQAAWAIKRAGYATDPDYSIKLMNIIETYDLHLLDQVGVE